MMIVDADYQNARRQIEELIDYLRKNQSTSCAMAEEDLILTRLADWQTDLKPNHKQAIAAINEYYRRFIEK
ncbi:branched-chain amino acid ABC transporter [Neisseria montereyensis]|uniref:Branched-chain amino acid ABC transporter n=1 Tax=Neisseria montereyensis TaxID=2973938 RepID=A0ABT2FC14_9NEIS|nr:branched-chain amino acid ABC transporter [Neisseria montereyensis]MCS4533678.1 branched-chain amino acid ABC transporter [Neisseria montereyensis]